MRKAKRSGGFLFWLLINMLINPEGLIAFIVLLALHFWLKWPLWIAFAVLGVWLLGIIIFMLVIGTANRCGNESTPPQENKNPYSVKEKHGEKAKS